MDRRDFFKTTGLGVFSLFLPKFEHGIWKPRPRPDWELALLDNNLKEVSGAGYARVTGSWADLYDPVTGLFANKATLQYPEAKGDWGYIHAARLIENRKKLPKDWCHEGYVQAVHHVRKNETFQFTPGNFSISLT
jgi:hypothetical protein